MYPVIKISPDHSDWQNDIKKLYSVMIHSLLRNRIKIISAKSEQELY